MLDLVTDELDEQSVQSTVEFSEIEVGEKFMTDRWIWQKVGQDTAKALAELMGKSSNLLGSIVHFHSWTVVRNIKQA